MITSAITYITTHFFRRLWCPIQLCVLFLYNFIFQRRANRDALDENKTHIQIQRWKSQLPGLSSRKRRNVRFSTCEVRTYESILGDNPSCSKGPPLGIGWNYFPDCTEVRSVDAFENHTRPQLCEADLIIERHEREDMLLNLGYSTTEIADATRQCIRARKKRSQTLDNLKVAKLEERLEGISKQARKMILQKKGTKVLYETWQKSGCNIPGYSQQNNGCNRRSSLILSNDVDSDSDASSEEGFTRLIRVSEPSNNGKLRKLSAIYMRRNSC